MPTNSNIFDKMVINLGDGPKMYIIELDGIQFYGDKTEEGVVFYSPIIINQSSGKSIDADGYDLYKKIIYNRTKLKYINLLETKFEISHLENDISVRFYFNFGKGSKDCNNYSDLNNEGIYYLSYNKYGKENWWNNIQLNIPNNCIRASWYDIKFNF